MDEDGLQNDTLREHQRFALMIEHSVRMANREVMHPVVDPLTDEKLLAVAVEVAKRRAAYTELTLKLGAPGEVLSDECELVSV